MEAEPDGGDELPLYGLWNHESVRTGAIPMPEAELCEIVGQTKSADEAVATTIARACESGLDHLTRTAYGMRMFAVIDFLAEQHDRLYEAGLLYPRDEEGDIISRHLLQVLATSQFTQVRDETGAGGKPHLGFDPDDVIIEAGRRVQADERDEPQLGTGEQG